MGDMLSQAEIDALLNGTSFSSSESTSVDQEEDLSAQEIDALGEIGNISMGTSATTLFTLLSHKVMITTPTVSVTTWEELQKKYDLPLVAVKVEYTLGLTGTNMLILREIDAKVITDLMMGGDGSNVDGELTDLHLSAISEAMNQMVGSSATSMSSMFDKRIDISPPKSFMISFDDDSQYGDLSENGKIVKISFKMIIGDLIDSEIMQLLPLSFAKSLVDNLLHSSSGEVAPAPPAKMNAPSKPAPAASQPQQAAPPKANNAPPPQQAYDQEDVHYGTRVQRVREPVSVQSAQFQQFDDDKMIVEKKNISMIMDVPLLVTVELGRTHRLIKDILEFGPGSIIELDKLAGEPVDILVNGKPIAKGEVMVIDESFGVRITDINPPSKRI